MRMWTTGWKAQTIAAKCRAGTDSAIFGPDVHTVDLSSNQLPLDTPIGTSELGVWNASEVGGKARHLSWVMSGRGRCERQCGDRPVDGSNARHLTAWFSKLAFHHRRNPDGTLGWRPSCSTPATPASTRGPDSVGKQHGSLGLTRHRSREKPSRAWSAGSSCDREARVACGSPTRLWPG